MIAKTIDNKYSVFRFKGNCSLQLVKYIYKNYKVILGMLYEELTEVFMSKDIHPCKNCVLFHALVVLKVLVYINTVGVL